MSKYKKLLAHLEPLETFDPAVFVGDDRFSQDVCDVILSLAVIYNDFRDVIFAQQLLESVAPEDMSITPALGMFLGLRAHVFRLTAGILRELQVFIEKNREVIDCDAFTKFVRLLPEGARAAWDSVVAATGKKPKDDELTKLLLFARNKVVFHYDRKEIGQAYARAFVSADVLGAPYVSRGDNMAKTRFYFADGVADHYMRGAANQETVKEFMTAGARIIMNVNHALREIVVRFVNARGFAWRAVSAT